MSAKKVIDCGLVSEDDKLIQRFKNLCDEFAYSFEHWTDHEAFMDAEPQCRMVAFFVPSDGDAKVVSQKATEMAQTISQFSAEAYRFAIFDKVLPKDDTVFLKKSGVHYIMSKHDVEETSKLEFFASQLIRAEYVPIKEMDLVVNVEVEFDIYHLMPLNGKFLKFVRSGNAFDERKKKKMQEVGEFYVHRKELPKFTEYARNFGDTSDGGVMRLCRAQFLEFQSKFGELAMMLTDESETMSFDEGKKLMENCSELAVKLASSLKEVGVKGMFDVINNSSVGGFGSLERAPAVAAYAAFFSMGVGVENLAEIIFGALIMDLGLITMHTKSTRKIRDNAIKEFNAEELEEYHRFPQRSIDLVLARRLPLNEEFKKHVMRSREQADGKGFPKGLDADALTTESQVLGFSSFFDSQTLLEMGKERTSPAEALREIITSQLTQLERFNAKFVLAIKESFDSAQVSKAA